MTDMVNSQIKPLNNWFISQGVEEFTVTEITHIYIYEQLRKHETSTLKVDLKFKE